MGVLLAYTVCLLVGVLTCATLQHYLSQQLRNIPRQQYLLAAAPRHSSAGRCSLHLNTSRNRAEPCLQEQTLQLRREEFLDELETSRQTLLASNGRSSEISQAEDQVLEVILCPSCVPHLIHSLKQSKELKTLSLCLWC